MKHLLLALLLTLTHPVLAADPVPHPHGEWYLLGHTMARQAAPTYRQFHYKNNAISRRLSAVLAPLGIQADTLKASQLQFLQLGWDHGIIGRPLAIVPPEDQAKSILPPQLRGYITFKNQPPAGANPADIPGGTLADKAALWKKAVVKVLIKLPDGSAHGSGAFIGPGLILTNHHVIEGATSIEVQLEEDASLHPATLIADQKVPDVALLRVQFTDHEILPIGRSSECRELEEVIMIGYPIFAEASATYVKGAISSTHRIFKKNEVLQLDIRSNHGNSGGPVITTDGRIIGILTFGLGGLNPELSQFTFAIKTDFVRPFLEEHARGLYQSAE
ncbi:S1C family serine protease [Prosthecobacter vanneervenii]|uniref:S1-C subfamily serine protease n=1 Tax=Prosthecobacter vanneervenii TaxID=48466 RepID=A0A7W7Y8B4_9BACT|nr:serine protease [Prosthecobacter vanneervenii]MBB5031492.1 S1-C subfamily serine protease [Prosthecobacter vanneervenii]